MNCKTCSGEGLVSCDRVPRGLEFLDLPPAAFYETCAACGGSGTTGWRQHAFVISTTQCCVYCGATAPAPGYNEKCFTCGRLNNVRPPD